MRITILAVFLILGELCFAQVLKLKESGIKPVYEELAILNKKNTSNTVAALKNFNVLKTQQVDKFTVYDATLKSVFRQKEYKPWESKKRFGMAVLELGIVELIPWMFSKYVTKPGWANVGLQTWWSNVQSGFEYDGDNFLTNNFAHPYHGSLYFNSARTNGYNFWESMPFAFAGSLFWEYFGEFYRPSINDWINTSVSGINLGEMLYRVSNVVTDNTAHGNDRL